MRAFAAIFVGSLRGKPIRFWSSAVQGMWLLCELRSRIRDAAQPAHVGDGVWDARACRSVGIPLIGIGTGSRATRLSVEGAVCVFPDFSDADIFLRSVYEITNAA